MKKWFLIGLILCITPSALAKRLYPEKTYQARWCKAHGGIMEYKLNDQTRVDCLLPTMAVEFDFANKYKKKIPHFRTFTIKPVLQVSEKEYFD